MALQPQPFSGDEDFQAMRSILTAGMQASRHSGYVHIGDLNWWLYYILPSKNCDLREIAYVWRNGDAVLGWSLFSPDGVFDLFVHPNERRGARRADMLAWTVERAAERAKSAGGSELSTEFVYMDDPIWGDLLAAHGFTPDASNPSLYTAFDLSSDLPTAPIPDGFTLRTVSGIHEAEARAAVHRAVFRKPADKYHSFMTTAPDYRLDLDVVVVAPDGQFAAFAQGWVDVENGIGLFEPVGTHPDFRKLGLCRAVIYEGLRRMHAAGATEAHVYPYENHDASQVYRKLGFQTRGKIIAYRKAL